MSERSALKDHARLLLLFLAAYWAYWAIVLSGNRQTTPTYLLIFRYCLLVAGGYGGLIQYFRYWRRVLGVSGRKRGLNWQADSRAWIYFFRPTKWMQIIRTAEWPVAPTALLLASLLALDLWTFAKLIST